MLNLLKIFREFFSNKLIINLIGLAAIAGLIWLATPYLGLQDATTRFYLIILLVIFYLLFLFAKKWWTHSRGADLYMKLRAQDGQQSSHYLEVELLKEKMSQAIQALKSSELGARYRGNAALYALPWFMLIGPSAAGKSTLLRNSGLHFPISDRADLNVKGFGGTRNCDWWFADEAIILDTAGRYTTEDADREEWQAFLQLLKKYRPRLPINGIIVALSLIDLLTADDEGISWHVKIIRERINELYAAFGYIFPIYFCFTKSDLLKGFNNFFADLNEIERQQIWGFNLVDMDDFSQKFLLVEQRLQNLYLKLIQLRIAKLTLERNQQRKAEIFEFPEQFKAAIPKILEFIQVLFKNNPYQEMPDFCGIYFTSGTQEGTPIERLLGNLREAFGYMEKNSESQAVTETKSYFIKKLFSEVVFVNKNSVAKTHYRLRIQRGLKSGSVLLAVISISAALMLYSAAFTNNILLLKRGKNLTKELVVSYRSHQYISEFVLNNLFAVGDYCQLLSDYQKQIPWYLRLGLYRGNQQIATLNDILSMAMQFSFLQLITPTIEKQLQSYSVQWNASNLQRREQLRGDYYTLLRAYLMLGFPQYLIAAQATPTLTKIWVAVLHPENVDAFQKQQTEKQYATLINLYLMQLQRKNINNEIAEPKLLMVRGNLVAGARQQLYSVTDANNLYAQLRASGETALPALSLSQLIHGDGANLLVSNQVLPKIYTAQGWHDYMKNAITEIARSASQGDWVIDAPLTDLANADVNQIALINTAVEKRLIKELRQLYFHDYAQHWFDFLASIQISFLGSLDDAVSQFNLLANETGPLAQLIKIAADNLLVKDEYLTSVAELKFSFASLYEVINPGFKKSVSSSVRSYLDELLRVQNDLQRLAASSNQARDAQQYASQILSGSGTDLELNKSVLTIDKITNVITNSNAKAALQAVLLQPIRAAWQSILTAATSGLQQQWQTQVYNNYQQTIAGRFPFTHQATEDVSANDINDFLQPKTGILWAFINNTLAPYLYNDAAGWHEQQWLGIGAGFSPAFLQALSQAKLISNSLFKNGNDQLGFALQIYPEPTPGLSEIILTTDGQMYRYQNGPQNWQIINWSSQNINQQSQLAAIAANNVSPNMIQTQGSWSLLHLFAQAQLTSQAESIFRVRWMVRNQKQVYPITWLVKSDSYADVIQLLLIDSFNFPQQLFAQK